MVGVSVTALGETRPGMRELVGDRGVSVDVSPSYGLDDFTAEQARSLAAFLAVTLEWAA